MVISSSAYSQSIPLRGFTPKEFLVIAVGLIQELGWPIDYISDAGLIAYADLEEIGKKIKVILKIERFTATLTSECTSGEHQDLGANQAAILYFTSVLNNSKQAYSTDELAKRYEELKPALAPPEESRLSENSQTFKESWTELSSIFTLREGYVITPLLIMINTVIFILIILFSLLLQSDFQTLIGLGANSRSETLDGQGWRLLSNAFLHWDSLHLFTNMLALYFIGSALEPHLNKGRFAVVYLLLGVLASVTSLWWHVKAVSAGASGAIFGLYGVFLALLTTNLLEPVQRKSLLPGMLFFIGYNLLGGREENIDHAAHIGGLVGGVVIGYFLYLWLKSKGRQAGIDQ